MSEITQVEAIRLCDILCKRMSEYDGLPWTFGHMADAGQSADFYVSAGEAELSVQHSRVEEVAGWFESGAVLQPVVDRLSERLRLLRFNRYLHLEFEKIPKSREEMESFCRAVSITMRLMFDDSKTHVRVRQDVVNGLRKIFEHVSDLHVESEASGLLSIGYKGWRISGVPVPDFANQLFEKLKRKFDHYPPKAFDVLLYEIEPSWIGEYYVDDLRERFADGSQKFSQIWVMTMAENGIAERLYPSAG